jgi:hypothetical protein
MTLHVELWVRGLTRTLLIFGNFATDQKHAGQAPHLQQPFTTQGNAIPKQLPFCDTPIAN